jgi:peptidoglycan/xylan/chitin deacetylase (PgdA/CDA1 family)
MCGSLGRKHFTHRIADRHFMVWRTICLIAVMLVALATAKARAADCAGNPNALGTSRVMSIDPREFPRIGVVQYSHSLPLEDKEVVLTFDDGPMPPYTSRVLDVLAEQCVKANYFLVGRMARGYPDLTRRIAAEGHTIGTHSENHLLGFDRAPLEIVKREIEQGIVSVGAALGNRAAVTPFFRIPGFLRRNEVEAYLQSRNLMTWSADAVADDWKHINASEVVRRSIARLDEKGKGILLLHDIQPATALALPELLRQLKAKGYRIVHVVPGNGETSVPVAAKPAPPATEAAPSQVANQVAAAAPAVVAPPKPQAAMPAMASRDDPIRAEKDAAKPGLATAADSLARGEDIAPDPVRPFTSGSKPSQTMPTPGKFVTTEPGGWPPTISVPVPRAGGIGVSSRAGISQTPDGRFQDR